ncbi:MAG TPA: hypothetical protein VFG93_10940 [Gaiellaceae bacterium]|nr:hypothetical protein [Gaiellaceae bacterium]
MIDAYLAELGRMLRLRFLVRRRLLAEVEDHLRDSARALGSEREAVARFGPPVTVASSALRAVTARGLFWAALILLGTLSVYTLPLYGIPENTLPPAPWDERPGYLTWKLYAALISFAVAGTAALVALVCARFAWSRVGLAALVSSAAAFALSAAAAAVLAVQWAVAVPGSTTTLALVLPATALTVCLGGSAVAVAILHAPASIGGRGGSFS